MSILTGVEIKTVNMGKSLTILVEGSYELMEKAVNQLLEWLEQKGVKPSGHMYTIFYDTVIDEKSETVRFEVCTQVDEFIEGEDVIRFREDFDQECAVIRYTGPYEGINVAYDTVLEWMEKNGYGIAGAAREVYVVRPKIGEYVDPKTFVTEIQFPVSKIEE